MFTWKSHAGLKFKFGQNDPYEIHTVLSFTSAQFMWTQVKSRINTEARFSNEMKSYTGLSSFRLSCERTLRCSRSQVFFKIGAFKSFVIFTGKYLCWSLFLIKLSPKTPKRSQHRCFLVNTAKFLRTPF